MPKVFVAFGMLVTLLEDEQGRSEREREQYQALFDCNPLAMWIYDPVTTRLTEANQTATRDFGWSHDELHTLTLRDLVRDADSTTTDLLELNRRLIGPHNPEFFSRERQVHAPGDRPVPTLSDFERVTAGSW